MAVHGPQAIQVCVMFTSLTRQGAIDLFWPPGPSAQALYPETDIHVYSRIHTERGLALENGAVWAGQRKANLLNDVI